MATSPQQEILDILLKELESGKVPWAMPWVVDEYGVVSHATGRPYSLRNRMLLKYGGEYATFRQVKASGGSVKKGEKAQRVFFAKYVERKSETDEQVKDLFYVLRAYPVFNVAFQCENVECKYRDLWERGGFPKDNAEVLELIRSYCERDGIQLRSAGVEAFFSPKDLVIQIPGVSRFANESQYWHSIFHEVAHSTGIKLGRKSGMEARFGDSEYAKEELVADICACLCLGRLGIPTDDCIPNSAAYIKGWQAHIKGFKGADLTDAIRNAELACHHIFNTQPIEKESNNG